MVGTDVWNKTDDKLFLKEGNAGVYREIKTLEVGKKHIIEVDPNATYREYVVVSDGTGKKVFVTSDDCIDNAVISIVGEHGNYHFEGVARKDAKAVDPAQGGFIPKFIRRFFPGKN